MKRDTRCYRFAMMSMIGLSLVVMPLLAGCQPNQAAATTNEASLRKDLQHKPTEAEMQQALAKAPPEVRAMVEAQMKQSQQKARPDRPKAAPAAKASGK